MEEIWKDVKNYEGIYQISNLGRVKSLERTVIKKDGRSQQIKESLRTIEYNVGDYRVVGLCKNGKQKIKRVARLVAEAFIPNPNNLPEVNHIDENKHNDSVQNLEWCSRSYNINHGTRNKRVGNHYIKRVYQYSLNGKLIKVFNSLSEAAKANNYLVGNMSVACRKVKEGATCNNYFFSYEPLTVQQLEKAAAIKQFYIEHKNRHPGYNDIKTL